MGLASPRYHKPTCSETEKQEASEANWRAALDTWQWASCWDI